MVSKYWDTVGLDWERGVQEVGSNHDEVCRMGLDGERGVHSSLQLQMSTAKPLQQHVLHNARPSEGNDR